MNIITVKQFSDYQVGILKDMFADDIDIVRMGYVADSGSIMVEYRQPRVDALGIFDEIKLINIPFCIPKTEQ